MMPLVLFVFAGCNNQSDPGSGPSLKPAETPAAKITVKCADKEVETYLFTYDETGRVSRMFRSDLMSGKTLFDLEYTYGGTADVLISGTFDGRGSKHTVSVSQGKSAIAYNSDFWSCWTYSVSIRGGKATGTSMDCSFTSDTPYYHSETSMYTEFVFSGNDIVQSKSASAVEGGIDKPFSPSSTESNNAEYDTDTSINGIFTYSENRDRQNFCSFLFDCSFPVWYAEGLPGCEHLVTDIMMTAGGMELPQKQHIDYTLDEKGNIVSARRIFLNEGKTYLTLDYCFEY